MYSWVVGGDALALAQGVQCGESERTLGSVSSLETPSSHHWSSCGLAEVPGAPLVRTWVYGCKQEVTSWVIRNLVNHVLLSTKCYFSLSLKNFYYRSAVIGKTMLAQRNPRSFC